MGIFGWSYPPGCNGTPYDEDSAIGVPSPALPAGASAWWDEYGNIEVYHEDGEREYRVGHLDWDDALSDADNLAAAAAVIAAYFEGEKE